MEKGRPRGGAGAGHDAGPGAGQRERVSDARLPAKDVASEPARGVTFGGGA